MILVFLWDTPFVLPTPAQSVHSALAAEFRAHPQILAIIDVAEHVQHTCKAHTCDPGRFVMDTHHPTTAVHLWIAVKLHQIIYKYIKDDRPAHVPLSRTPLPAARTVGHTTAAAAETWTCNDTPNGPRLWTRLFAEPHRTVSWTADKPALLKQGLAIMVAGGVLELINQGKAATTRVDRQQAVMVPHCNQEHRLAFEVPRTCANPLAFSFHLGASEIRPRLELALEFQATGLTVEKIELTGCYMSRKTPSHYRKQTHFQHWGLLSDSAAVRSVAPVAPPGKDAIEISVCTHSAKTTTMRWMSVLCGD